MKYAFVLLAVVCSLSSVHAQWSVPAYVGIDTTLHSLDGFQLAAGGDTLWLFYDGSRDFNDTTHALAHWSTGDSWSAPETLVTAKLMYCLSSGVDPQRRLWLSWYNGGWPILGGEECQRADDTWGIWTRVHDSLGWCPVRLALLACSDYLDYPLDLSFAADRNGNWYMGICNECLAFYTSALYSRFEGDTWSWPRIIARGYGDPLDIDYRLLSLVARPDTGFWAVYTKSAKYTESSVLVDHLIPDSSCVNITALHNIPSFAATGDSAGQMWIVYVDTLGAIRSITYDVDGERRRQLVTDDHYRVAFEVCTDPDGWVWAFWSRGDTTPVVSCNWGNNWSEPEAVTSKKGYPVDVVSDQHGRVYVCFRDKQGSYWTCYRAARPGIDGAKGSRLHAIDCAASVVRVLAPDRVVFDAMGRRVVNPRSGVFFVRDEGRGAGGAGQTRKVVLQR
jgi:hypothetical protein